MQKEKRNYGVKRIQNRNIPGLGKRHVAKGDSTLLVQNEKP
jgi:hypothetical protein